MTETDISKVLIEGEYATIMGVKYKRVEEPKTAVEEAYKDWWGQYPELETDSEYDEMRWQGFRAGFQAAYEEKVSEDNYHNEVAKPSRPQTLYEILCYEILCAEQGQFIDREFICEIVEDWLPLEGCHELKSYDYSAGWNDCIKAIRRKLR